MTRLTFNEKAELDALVNTFGGKSMLVLSWKKDPSQRRMVRKGVVRWGKVRNGMVEHVATKKGVAMAKRFKKDWAGLWGERHPETPE